MGIYAGPGKPEANDLLKDFIRECVYLTENGLILSGQQMNFNISKLIRTPAKSYILYISKHTGFFSCTKCF